MGILPLSRLTLIGLALLLPGLYYAIRFGSGFLRVLTRKFRRGVPYLKGSATDYLLFAAACLVVTLVGAVLTTVAVLQGRFQTFTGPREVGKVVVDAKKPGRIRLALTLEPSYPGDPRTDIELPGASWALEGEFISWGGRLAWLGFRDGHRMEAVLGSAAASGPAQREAESRIIVSGTDSLWYLAHRQARRIPCLKTTASRTPWMRAESGTFRVFASADGYVLVEVRDPGDGSP
jgi:hypothetical protein